MQSCHFDAIVSIKVMTAHAHNRTFESINLNGHYFEWAAVFGDFPPLSLLTSTHSFVRNYKSFSPRLEFHFLTLFFPFSEHLYEFLFCSSHFICFSPKFCDARKSYSIIFVKNAFSYKKMGLRMPAFQELKHYTIFLIRNFLHFDLK